MTTPTISTLHDANGRLHVELRLARPGETSPVWEIVGHRRDGDRVHFNGDVAAALFVVVADLTLSRDITRIDVTAWLTE